MPSAKMPISAIFCLLGRLRLLMTGIGRMTRTMSKTMLVDAWENHMAPKLTQWPPLMVLSQKYGIGVQSKMLMMTVSRVKRVLRTKIIRQAICIFLVAKMRMYCSRIEILVRPTAPL